MRELSLKHTITYVVALLQCVDKLIESGAQALCQAVRLASITWKGLTGRSS